MAVLKLPLRVVLYKEDGYIVSHCLEFDVMGSGETTQESFEDLATAITIQIKHSVENGNSANLFSPADGKFLRMFAAGKDVAKGHLEFHVESDDIEIEGIETREYDHTPDCECGELACV